jgi:uncharacterized protein (DUF885 family)
LEQEKREKINLKKNKMLHELRLKQTQLEIEKADLSSQIDGLISLQNELHKFYQEVRESQLILNESYQLLLDNVQDEIKKVNSKLPKTF